MLTFAPGKVGQAFSFNGINQYVSTPTAITNLANNFTNVSSNGLCPLCKHSIAFSIGTNSALSTSHELGNGTSCWRAGANQHVSSLSFRFRIPRGGRPRLTAKMLQLTGATQSSRAYGFCRGSTPWNSAIILLRPPSELFSAVWRLF